MTKLKGQGCSVQTKMLSITR